MHSNTKGKSILQQTPEDCIKTCLESLGDQLSPYKNCLKSVENLKKPVKFYGISVNKSSLNVDRLTDYIKTHTTEFSVAKSHKIEDNNSDILEIFPSPSRFYKEICDNTKTKSRSKFSDIANDGGYDYLNTLLLDDEDDDDKENSFSLHPCQNTIVLDSSNDHDLSDILTNMSVHDLDEQEESHVTNSLKKKLHTNENDEPKFSTPKPPNKSKSKKLNISTCEHLVNSQSNDLEIISLKNVPETDLKLQKLKEKKDSEVCKNEEKQESHKENFKEQQSYKLPFKSHCETENRDINDPKWDVYKMLKTDEERYYIVRKHWKNLIIPDPNEDLTLHSFRSRKKYREAEKSEESILRKGKRSREHHGNDKDLPPSKRMRIFRDVSFNSRAIERTLKTLKNDYEKEVNTIPRSYDHLMKLDKAYEEYVHQMHNARQEAAMVHKFYTGLPNQKVVTQEEIEDEQRQIERVYDLFKRYYNWSGKVFNPVIKIFKVVWSYDYDE